MYHEIFILLYYYFYYFLSIVKRLSLKRISAIEILLYCIVNGKKNRRIVIPAMFMVRAVRAVQCWNSIRKPVRLLFTVAAVRKLFVLYVLFTVEAQAAQARRVLCVMLHVRGHNKHDISLIYLTSLKFTIFLHLSSHSTPSRGLRHC